MGRHTHHRRRASWLVLLLALTLATPCLGKQRNPGSDAFVGWKGDSYYPEQDTKRTWIELISWKPRAFIIHNLITDAEAIHIASEAAPTMKRSTVVGANGSSVEDDYRTSFGTFLNRYHTPVVRALEERVSQIVRVPVIHQEDMQVLRYGVGQFYKPHQDSLDDESPRMATLLIYLADAEVGGETSFPQGSEWVNPILAQRYGAEFSDCAKGQVGIKPRRGDALLFWSIDPDGKTEDIHSTHQGCPVIKGAKWTATIWVHSRPFRPNQYNAQEDKYEIDNSGFQDPGLCGNSQTEQLCTQWAKQGECEKNKGYMVAHCAEACGVCVKCASKDLPCYSENRRKAGYLVYDPAEFLYNRPMHMLTNSAST